MDRNDPKDRAAIARMGGYATQQRRRLALSPEQISEEARRMGEATLAKYGKGHFQRMSLIAAGKLPPKKKSAVTSSAPKSPGGENL